MENEIKVVSLEETEAIGIELDHFFSCKEAHSVDYKLEDWSVASISYAVSHYILTHSEKVPENTIVRFGRGRIHIEK